VLMLPMVPFRFAIAVSGLLACGVAATASAERVTVTLVRHGEPVPNAAATLTIRSILRTGPSEAAPAPVERVLPVAGSAVVELPAGEWTLDVESESYWHQRQFFATDGGPNVRQVSAPLWRSGIVTSAVLLRDGSAPKDVKIRFASIEQPGDGERFEGESVCPVTDKRIRCRVAAGLFDLRLRCEGCIAHYLGETLVPAAGEVTGRTGV